MAHADAAAGSAGELPGDLRALIGDERDLVANCANAAALIWHRLPRLNWAGFYLLRGDELVLGPFQGKPACTRIALARGVCGAAATRRVTLNVPDVVAFPGHIACDSASRSELVVPLLKDGRLIGVNTAIATSPLATRAAVMDADDAFNFILVGDSIMAGTTSGGATSDHYLSATLGSKSYFSGRATIINKGVSGRTTTQIVSDWTTGANTDAYAYRPSNNGGKRAVILVCAGINDWNTSASMTTALSNMTTYVTNAKAAGFEVWLGIPLPASYGGINDYATRTGMKAYIRGLRSLTTPDKKIDFSQLVHNMTGTGTGSIWTGDSLHPNNALYDTMADLINLRAWGDDRLAVSVDLGTMAFQDSDAGRFDGVADFYSTPNRYAATGTTAEYGAKVAGAGSNKQVKFGHTSVINGNVPANGFVLSIWNGSAWETMGFGQAGDLNVPRTVRPGLVSVVVAAIVIRPVPRCPAPGCRAAHRPG